MSIAMALGYKNNAEAFLNLFLYLLPYRDFNETSILAMALGICGFLEDRYEEKWGSSDKYQTLKQIWIAQSVDVLHQTQLKVDKIRPLNHPIRRLAYLSKLIGDPCLDTLYGRMKSLLKSEWSSCAKPKTGEYSCKKSRTSFQTMEMTIGIVIFCLKRSLKNSL